MEDLRRKSIEIGKVFHRPRRSRLRGRYQRKNNYKNKGNDQDNIMKYQVIS